MFWQFGQFVAHRMNDDPLNPKKNHDQTVFLDLVATRVAREIIEQRPK